MVWIQQGSLNFWRSILILLTLDQSGEDYLEDVYLE